MKATQRAKTAPTSNQRVPRTAKTTPKAVTKTSTTRPALKRQQPGRPKRTPQDKEASAVVSAERLTFARNLRRSRRWLEISQEEMALRAGMSRSYVSGVELGERNLTVDNMARLATVLGLPLHQLLDPSYVPDTHLK